MHSFHMCIGNRKEQEDRVVVEPPFYTIIDGHGGAMCADAVASAIHTHLKDATTDEESIKEKYALLHKEGLVLKDGSGCVLSTLIIRDKEYVTHNLGDCRIVLAKMGRGYPLTFDHVYENFGERARVCREGGVWSMDQRVNGYLIPSRSIGDAAIARKNALRGISHFPETRYYARSYKDDFLILATDGVWDFHTVQDLVKDIYRLFSLQQDFDTISRTIANRTRYDNASVILVPVLQSDDKLATWQARMYKNSLLYK